MLVTLNSCALTAIIAARGAEIQSVRDRTGHEWIWQGAPPWSRRAPVLFPVVGALGGGGLRHRGESYPIAMHGFAADADFAQSRHDDGRCSFTLASSTATRAAFPFDFELTVGFALDGVVLTQTVTVRNPADRPLPIQIGLHPGFCLPQPGGVASAIVAFDSDESPAVRRLRGGHACETAASPIRGRVLVIEPSTFDEGGILLESPRSREVWYGRPGAPGVANAFRGFTALAFWSKGRAPFLCIEPWRGVPDTGDFRGELMERGQLAVVPAGASFEASSAMTFGAALPAWASADTIDHTSYIR